MKGIYFIGGILIFLMASCASTKSTANNSTTQYSRSDENSNTKNDEQKVRYNEKIESRQNKMSKLSEGVVIKQDK